jgi:DNA-binding GntR family transcriptional regulator
VPTSGTRAARLVTRTGSVAHWGLTVGILVCQDARMDQAPPSSVVAALSGVTVEERDLTAGHVFKILQAKILAGLLAPGAKLVERDLSAALGVSRSPVREALTRLESAGLSVRLPNGVRIVQPLAQKDLVELYQMRQFTEGFAMRLACEVADSEHLKEARALLGSMEAALQNPAAYRRLNRDFHRHLVQPCPNRRLKDLYGKTAEQVEWCTKLTLSTQLEPSMSFEGHVAMLEAYSRRDADALEMHARAHIGLALGRLIENIKG